MRCKNNGKKILNYFKTPKDYSLIFTIKANYTVLENKLKGDVAYK